MHSGLVKLGALLHKPKATPNLSPSTVYHTFLSLVAASASGSNRLASSHGSRGRHQQTGSAGGLVGSSTAAAQHFKTLLTSYVMVWRAKASDGFTVGSPLPAAEEQKLRCGEYLPGLYWSLYLMCGGIIVEGLFVSVGV